MVDGILAKHHDALPICVGSGTEGQRIYFLHQGNDFCMRYPRPSEAGSSFGQDTYEAFVRLFGTDTVTLA